MSGEDVLYGGLFKCPLLNGQPSRSWSKNFVAFNRRNMMLQYWTSDEERIFKVEGCVRTRPRGFISLLSSTLKVERGDIERSMFAQKYPILIHNGPDFNGRILQLAASSSDMREKWIYMINSAISNLKERQRVALIKKSIITDKSDPGFKTLDNQHRVLVKKEEQLKELDEKIARSQLQCKLLNSKDKQLYEHQERLRILHREQEDKLYSLTCNETHPQRMFKFVQWCTDDVMEDMFPYGADGSYASTRINTKYGRKDVRDHEKADKYMHWWDDRVDRTKNFQTGIYRDKHRPINDLTDDRYYPNHSDVVVVDQTGKEFDTSKKVRKPKKVRFQIKKHDVRNKPDSSDEEMDEKSFSQLGVFEAMKDEDRREEYNEFFDKMSRIMDTTHDQEGLDEIDSDDERRIERAAQYQLQDLMTWTDTWTVHKWEHGMRQPISVVKPKSVYKPKSL